MDFPIIQDTKRNRFVMQLEGGRALVTYRLFDGGIAFLHTEVPEAYSGQGIGARLARHVLDYAREHSLKVKPYCPFIKAYIDSHPEYQSLSLFHQAQDEG